jgi:hypothetical protein
MIVVSGVGAAPVIIGSTLAGVVVGSAFVLTGAAGGSSGAGFAIDSSAAGRGAGGSFKPSVTNWSLFFRRQKSAIRLLFNLQL